MTITFENYNALLENDKQLAMELLQERAKGTWQKEQIYYYDDVESFAEYELLDGWYTELNLDRHFNGAPNPINYINLNELGHALVASWDDSSHFLSDSGEILQTSYGW